jgi:hypothetical protein
LLGLVESEKNLISLAGDPRKEGGRGEKKYGPENNSEQGGKNCLGLANFVEWIWLAVQPKK